MIDMYKEKKQIDLEANEERLLNYLVDNGIKEIKPTIRYDSIKFDELEDFRKINRIEDLNSLLKNVTLKGYFNELEFDRSIFCPNCGSIHKQTKYNCARCNSIKVKRYELIEHSTCGYIAERKAFLNEENIFVCPGCSRKTTSKTRKSKNKDVGVFNVIGTSYSCDNCGHKFDKPEVTNICQNCGTIYDYKNSLYNIQYYYNLTDKIMEITPIRQTRHILRTTESILNEHGYEVKLDGVIEGKSGEKRVLDIVAEKDEKMLLIDLSHWGKEEDILSLLGKKMDTDAEATIMIDISGNEKMKQLGEIYNIKTFNSIDPVFLKELSDYLSSLEVIPEKPKGFSLTGILKRTLEPKFELEKTKEDIKIEPAPEDE
jgi:DNA-directed RNA polymerase subunit RPC12/RpoP